MRVMVIRQALYLPVKTARVPGCYINNSLSSNPKSRVNESINWQNQKKTLEWNHENFSYIIF